MFCQSQDEEPQYSSRLQDTVGVAESALARTKARIGQLLHLLQNISQIQKLSKLESLYGAPTGKAAKHSHPLASAESARRRTRSVGAIKLGKSKHARTLTSDLT
jgi:hypothetical protein